MPSPCGPGLLKTPEAIRWRRSISIGYGQTSTVRSAKGLKAMKLTKDTETYLLDSIKRFFAQEIEMDIGDLKAGQVLEYFTAELGPSIYNQAIADAQVYMTEKVSDLAGVHNPAEFDYWKKR